MLRKFLESIRKKRSVRSFRKKGLPVPSALPPMDLSSSPRSLKRDVWAERGEKVWRQIKKRTKPVPYPPYPGRSGRREMLERLSRERMEWYDSLSPEFKRRVEDLDS